MADKNLWTREELILAFNLYCKIPFSKTVKSNPQIMELAGLIGRTPSSVAMKLGNLGRLDPELQNRNISGLSRGSKLDEVIWNEFYNNNEQLIIESELLYQKLVNPNFEKELEEEIKEGKEKERLIKVRINQTFFRSSILASYNYKCCITGINNLELLSASHIIPWSKDTMNRLNPRNGLCLNSLHDKAFDRGLLTITPDYKIVISKKLKLESSKFINNSFLNFEGQSITLPGKFYPHKDFLEYHNKNIFID